MDIRTISKYLNIHEIPCKSCGSVNSIDEIIIVEQRFANGKIHMRGECAHCGTFIRYMPTSAIKRVFWKGQMQDLASFETGLLQWMINNNYGSTGNRLYIEQVLMARLMDPGDVPDFFLPEEGLKELKRQKELEYYTDKAEALRIELVRDSHKMDYSVIREKQRKMEALKAKIVNLSK